MTSTSASAVLLLALSLGAEPGFDRGAAGLWQKLQKLQTRASLLHTTAHPDDEHGGMLALMSRGRGVRVALVSLTRGEAGANAIGPELFDGLGWIRAEELRLAGRYYGLDALYFTRLADYGYSKRLEEAISKWGREDALRDLVHVIRMERPMVIVSRFQGNERDGHGQHRFTGVVTREAFHAAGDPSRFPEQLEQGLEAWQPLKLYVGGARGEEDRELAVDVGVFSPWLGDSFVNVARRGLSLQRSQTSGRLRRETGSFIRYYERVESLVDSTDEEESFFDGIDTSLPPEIARHAAEALAAFDPEDLAAVVAPLSRALSETRRAKARSSELAIKEQQIEEAIATALAVELRATVDRDTPVVPGSELEVHLEFHHRGGTRVREVERKLHVPDGWIVRDGTKALVVPQDARPWRPHVSRASIDESRYRGEIEWWRGAPRPPAYAEVLYEVEDVRLRARAPLMRRESSLPYGEVERELVVLPPASVTLRPSVALSRSGAPFEVEVEVEVEMKGEADLEAKTAAAAALDLPEGFRAESLGAGRFRIFPPDGFLGEATVRAVVRLDGRSLDESYVPIEHRDLETRYLVTPAATKVIGLDVAAPSGLAVGYVMGVGDHVPEAIEQLGASVRRLTSGDLASGDLSQLDAIVIGTRAYAVRDDLRSARARVLDYVRRGGNLVVLYQTPEFQPRELAPRPGELPGNAEEVSEEDAPIEILAPSHRALNEPNVITPSDFDGWVEQRGSKFWSAWDGGYTAVVASHDTGQSPQAGGWLWCRYGDGNYTYFAYALHRQLPFGVPGAYRLLANLLALGDR